LNDEWNEFLQKSKYINIDGVKTHYFEAGKGDTIFLVHGGGLISCAEINWGAVILPLSKHFHIIAPDLPGFGFTTSRGIEDHQRKNQASFLIQMIVTLGEEKVTLCGNSAGGFKVMYVALDRPDLVNKLIIVNSGSASRIQKEEETIKFEQTRQPTIERTLDEIIAMRKNYFVNPDYHPFWKKPITDEKVKRLYDIKMRNYEFNAARHEKIRSSVEARNRALSYKGKHISESAHQLTMPVLLTWSVTPGILPRLARGKEREMESGINLFEKIKGAEMHIFHNAKHHLMTDQAPRWVKVVTDFVKS